MKHISVVANDRPEGVFLVNPTEEYAILCKVRTLLEELIRKAEEDTIRASSIEVVVSDSENHYVQYARFSISLCDEPLWGLYIESQYHMGRGEPDVTDYGYRIVYLLIRCLGIAIS